MTWATHTAKSPRVAQRPTFYGAAPWCALGGTVQRARAACVTSSATTSTPRSSSAPTIPSESTSSTRPCCFRPRDEDRAADLQPPDVPCSQAWTRVRFRTVVGRNRLHHHFGSKELMPKGLDLK
jgi:hypothetical protein